MCSLTASLVAAQQSVGDVWKSGVLGVFVAVSNVKIAASALSAGPGVVTHI